jgi:hypothetical protein
MKAPAQLSRLDNRIGVTKRPHWPAFVYEAGGHQWLLDQWTKFFTELEPGRQIHVRFDPVGRSSALTVSIDGKTPVRLADTSALPAGEIRESVEELIRTLIPIAHKTVAAFDAAKRTKARESKR